MKRLTLSILMTLVFALCANAQGLHFGYFSYDTVLKAMPEYALMQKQLADLRAQYEAEATRAEEDFNTKYEQFLDGQRDFPQRQTELQELMEKNIAFKAESRRLLAAAEQEAMAPLHQKLQTAVQQIGMERGYAFVLNTDQNACPFINPDMGEDITTAVLDLLK